MSSRAAPASPVVAVDAGEAIEGSQDPPWWFLFERLDLPVPPGMIDEPLQANQAPTESTCPPADGDQSSPGSFQMVARIMSRRAGRMKRSAACCFGRRMCVDDDT